MTSQPLFIPLYFDEADMDLWAALQRVDPVKRSAFIKGTLKEALLGSNSEKPFSQVLTADNTMEEDEAQIEKTIVTEAEKPVTFSLDDLFTQTSEPQLEAKPDIKPAQEASDSLPGFEYMMKHIIGTEDDEAVLKVLWGRG